MPIAELMANPELQIVGKIRLGQTSTSAKGSQYPEDLTYFSFHSLPEDVRLALERLFGKEPRAIDIMFVSNDPLENAANDYKMYGQGKIGSDGQRLGGKLLCKGPGPTMIKDGDETIENPGVAEHWAMRDPVTRVVPPRPCMGRKCPDYIAKKCKQAMQLVFIIPTYSWQVGFAIDTTSWNSITSVIGLLSTTSVLTQGTLKHIPFKLTREETSIPYWDEKAQQDKVSTHWCMYLRPNDDFFDRVGPAALKNIDLLKKVQFSLRSTIQELTAGPMEDHFPALPASDAEAVDIGQRKPTAQETLLDPEVQSLFAELEKAMGKQFNDKSRLVAIRRLEVNSPPDLKAAVVSELNQKIAEASSKPSPQSKPIEPVAKATSEGIL